MLYCHSFVFSCPHADLFSPCHRQPVLADEVQTFKALITLHKVLQEGHPIVIREAQQHANWIDSLMRGVGGDGLRGTQTPYRSMRLGIMANRLM